MKSTLFLTGKPTSYFEPEQSALVKKRIEAIDELIRKLVAKREIQEGKELQDTIFRYTEAMKAKKFWVELLVAN